MSGNSTMIFQRVMRVLSALVFILLFAGCVNSTPKYDVRVVSAEFGVFEDFHAKHLVFTKTDHVPWKVGQDFGWRIKLSKPVKVIWVREELTLPAPANQWINESPVGSLKVFEGKDGAISEYEVNQEGGYFYGSWAIVSGDPSGAHSLKVFIDGKPVTEFKFNVDRPI